MEEENKWNRISQIFDFLITEDNEPGQLVCSNCKENITKDKSNHKCPLIKEESQPDFIYF